MSPIIKRLRAGSDRASALRLVLAAGLAAAALSPPAASAGTPEDRGTVDVVVLEQRGAGEAPEHAVTRLGGAVERQLPVVHGFVARVPAGALHALRDAAGVASVTRDRAYTLRGDDEMAPAAGATLDQVRDALGAGGISGGGAGVDVAMVDSGVTPAGHLDDPDRLLYGPDLSRDAVDEDLRDLDAFGHGTHLAGIVAGVAPSARIVSVKVADGDGSTTLSRLLAGIDWVVSHRDSNGLDIRVLNLAFGAEGGDYRTDPMAVAVERAWQRGIAVVASAGNGGPGSTSLDSPANDPYVLAVGGADMAGTADVADDLVAPFSSRGSATRSPDVVAPAAAIVSLRSPGSYLDEAFPGARVGEHGFRGSGTSQASAAASGAAAALLGARPDLTPDALKALLRASARSLPAAGEDLQGRGLIDVAAAAGATVAKGARQSWPRAIPGLARRAPAMAAEIVVEHPSASRWSASRWSASRWSASRWSVSHWSASRWSASRWSASRWSASRWSASRWSASRWSASRWSASRWSADSWAG